MLTKLAALADATAAFVDDKRELIWVTQADGTIASVLVAGGGATPAQLATSAPTGLSGNSRVLVLAHKDGSIATLDPDDPSAPLTVVSRSKSAFGQVGVTAGAAATAVVVTRSRVLGRPPFGPIGGRAGSLTLVKLTTGASSGVALDGVTGVAVLGSAAYAARNASGSGGEVGILKGTVFTVLASGLPPVGRLGLAEGGDVLLVTHPGAKLLSVIRPSTGSVDTYSTASISGDIVEVHGVSRGRLAILTTDALVLAASIASLHRDPSIHPLTAAVFVGSWVELGFDLGTTGLSKNDVRFEVPDGPDAGFVSYTRPNNEADPVPLLVVGGRVGVHTVKLVEIATSNVLATTDFEITDHWADEDTGPGGCYMTNASFDGASGWGGGPNSPQNLNVHPHVGTWRSMVLMVDTLSGRWPTGAALTTNRTDILNHVANGFAFGGDNRSARLYYEENSQFVASPAKGLTVSVLNNQTYGPVSLPNAWTDYFAQKTDADGNVVDEKWSSKGGTLQTIISRAIADNVATTADFTNLDVLIVVPFSPDAMGGPPARFVWPHANDAREFLCGTNAMTDRRSFGYTFVPLDFAAHDGRQMHTTLSHELGHTLSLPDLYDVPDYSDDITNRLTTNWDMMAGSRDALPHFTLSNKMRMGWVQPGHLKLYNFQGSSAVAQDITLHAAELGDPPSGRVKGIEIRLGDGWNYYVEYRAEQSAQVTDDLPTDRRVVITDVTSDTYTAPIARPPIVFVRNDIDGDGPILGNSADLEEKDPGTQMDLKVEVISTAVDNAVVRVSYGSNGKPEPGIRPWTGGPNWQSPDIEIRNDKATADPANYFNTPWLGHDNTIVARVRNSGDLLARGVVVDFFVTEYLIG